MDTELVVQSANEESQVVGSPLAAVGCPVKVAQCVISIYQVVYHAKLEEVLVEASVEEAT